MYEEIRKKAEKHRGFFLVVFPAAIMLIYLGCECFHDFSGVLYYLYPALMKGLMILSVYLAWRCYMKEQVPVSVSILLSGLAVILPFAGEMHEWSGWDWAEKIYEFVWLLWPVIITCLSNYCTHKLYKKKKYICGMNLFIVLLLSVLLHRFAEGGEGATTDLCILVMWIAEGLLWTFVLNDTSQEKDRKRNLMVAWIACLLLFGCFTFVDISYLSVPAIWTSVRGRYWNEVIFLCLPVILLFVIKMSEIHLTKSKLYYMQKRSLLYFLIVLLLIYFIPNIGLNFALESLKYDVADGVYLLLLADIMFWRELYRKSEQAGSRIKGAAFMVVINVGIFIFFLIENLRLREVLSYVGSSFAGSSRTVSQVDWVGYRKAAFEAFLSRDLTILDHSYGKEKYMYSVCGDGLTSIRFRCGLLPVLVMVLLLLLFVILLWNWNREDILLNQCAGYLAISYILKMSIAFILQANMIVSPYMEFPFTEKDIAAILLPILLVCESSRRTMHL